MDEMKNDFAELCKYVEKLTSKYGTYINCAAWMGGTAQISTKVKNEYVRFDKNGVVLKHKKGLDMNGFKIYMVEK